MLHCIGRATGGGAHKSGQLAPRDRLESEREVGRNRERSCFAFICMGMGAVIGSDADELLESAELADLAHIRRQVNWDARHARDSLTRFCKNSIESGSFFCAVRMTRTPLHEVVVQPEDHLSRGRRGPKAVRQA